MKFILDTDDYDNMEFVLTEADKKKSREELIEEFEYALSSFFISFCVKNNWNTEEAKERKQGIFTRIDRYIAQMLRDGILEPLAEVFDEEFLKVQMAKEGFSEEEIEHMVELVRECGSIEKASECLYAWAEEQGVDLKEAE